MALTSERAEAIGKYLTDDTERAKELLNLTPEEAAAKMDADGNNFTVEEIIEFGEQLKTAAAVAQDGELAEDALDNVAGGFLTVSSAAAVCLAVGIGVGAAYVMTHKW